MSDARQQEVIDLFASHGAVLDADLAERLATEPEGPVHVDAVLRGLKEIPFHFDENLWNDLVEQSLEHATTASPKSEATEQELARKAALKAKAAAIYDSGTVLLEPDADDDVIDDHEDELTIPTKPELGAALEAKQFEVKPRSEWRPVAAQHEGRLEIVEDMTGQSTCEGSTGDFTTYFQDRYDKIERMLRQRRELRNATEIERVAANQQEVAVIGMVTNKNITRHGHRRIEIEDRSGAINVLVNKNERQLIAFADTLVTDEVIGVVAQAGDKGDILFATDLVRPDIPRNRTDGGRADVPVMAAFLSDIHVGSNTFLTENWKSMLRWLAGDAPTQREREVAGRVKYLVIPGDLVDGVGIYPGQQDELTIPDVYDQYGAFGDWMKDLPDHLEVVVQPGNHDASRPAEPQPAFTQEVRERFDHHNAHFVANPAWFKMHDVLTLGYHGSSLIDFATSVTHLEYEEPLPAMKQMLQSRHMAPLYGERTPVAPEHNDYLVINEVPDLFITGHVHVPGIESYRGVQMVNCGTWQSQTVYQRMLNFTPDPARMPLIDLQNLRGTLVDFQTPLAAQ